MKYLSTVLIGLVFLASACMSSQKTSNPDTTGTLPACPPDGFVIEGKIIEIVKRYDPDSGAVCHSYPCYAKVGVLEVLERRNRYETGMETGDTLLLKFAFTLSPTRQIFRDMAGSYPGLAEGDVFQANVKTGIVTNDFLLKFVVFEYRILKDQK
jgi:hypothetical protein